MYKYYVYELSSSIDDKVFYIGKGCGNRIDHHENEARKGVSSKKCNKIRKIWNYGGQIKKTKIAYFKDEQYAFEFEDHKISEFGKQNLCNVAPLMNGEDKATINPYLSDDFMRLVAIGIRDMCGVLPIPQGMWAKALLYAMRPRWKELLQKGFEKVGFDEIQNGVARYGVILKNGCQT